ncbi:hypothetical protein LOS78_01880 [Paracoccus sp. MA]|uniref:hypothetical protein n=1 Tax=Paracoccus sp. MA TaxID=2895796 RepID=UPI001E65C1CC|nr:hypothetical protein [Paracoccus sp. MA]UFM64249.1 hypothetical protein LOS78_01880 [Paracoccus sp. MA]
MAFGTSFGAFVEGFDQARRSKKADAEREKTNAMNDRLLSVMEKQDASAASMMPMLGAIRDLTGAIAMGQGRGGGSIGFGRPSSSGGTAGGDNSLAGLLKRYEGAGDFDTLYGHAQNEGGRFAGVRPSQMTLDELDAFDKEYGQWVAERNGGVVATPVGFGQIVGTTRRNAAKAMGLSGDTVFSPEVQQAMVDHLAWNRVKGVSDPAARRAALRQEWVGFSKAPDADVDAAIESIIAKHQPALGAIRS